MGDTNTEKWKTVKLPKGLSERVDEFVKSQEAYHQGGRLTHKLLHTLYVSF